MRCDRCGTEVPTWATSCPTCGTPVTADGGVLPPPPPEGASEGDGAGAEGSAQWWSRDEPSGPGSGDPGRGWGAPGSPPPGQGWSGQHPTGQGWSGQGTRSSGGLDSSGWSTLAHLSALSTFIVPFGNIVAPLVIWLIRRDVDPVSAEHARTALNFQISWTIWIAIAALLMLLLIGFLLLPILGIAWLVLVVVAGVKASRGEPVRYPLTISFVS